MGQTDDRLHGSTRSLPGVGRASLPRQKRKLLMKLQRPWAVMKSSCQMTLMEKSCAGKMLHLQIISYHRFVCDSISGKNQLL